MAKFVFKPQLGSDKAISKTNISCGTMSISTDGKIYFDGPTERFIASEKDKHFVFEQGVSSKTWVIEHNLDKYPSIVVMDSAGTEVEGDIEYTSKNKVVLRFSAEFSGKAYLN